jgi:fused signal recognition particle receptor
MDELRKVKRVAAPDVVLYIGEAITGNDCIEQASIYNEEIGIDGIILTKVDVDEKGGTALSISYVTKTPVWLIGDGQNYQDLKRFDNKLILDNLGLE